MEKKKYIVKFEDVPIFEHDSDVQCVQFAVSLHQASNVPHTIEVREVSEDNTLVLVFFNNL